MREGYQYCTQSSNFFHSCLLIYSSSFFSSQLIEQILLAYVKGAHIILDFSEVTLPPDDDLTAGDKKDEDTNSFSAKLTRAPVLDDQSGGQEENLFNLTWEVVAPLKYDQGARRGGRGGELKGRRRVLTRIIRDHTHSVKSLAVHPCESLILSSARDGVKCWSLSNSRPVVCHLPRSSLALLSIFLILLSILFPPCPPLTYSCR